jgi:hypothetical protein
VVAAAGDRRVDPRRSGAAPVVIGVNSIGGVTNMAANLALHAAGIAVLLLVLLVPSLARGLDRRFALLP